MSYTVLNDYLATKDKATVEQGFRQYISIYGTDDIGNEAWPTYSFALLGKSEPSVIEPAGKVWTIHIQLLHGFIEFNRNDDTEGTIIMTFFYHVSGYGNVNGWAEYLSDPLDIKAWFNKHFSNFVKQYMEHEQGIEKTQEGTDITEV